MKLLGAVACAVLVACAPVQVRPDEHPQSARASSLSYAIEQEFLASAPIQLWQPPYILPSGTKLCLNGPNCTTYCYDNAGALTCTSVNALELGAGSNSVDIAGNSIPLTTDAVQRRNTADTLSIGTTGTGGTSIGNATGGVTASGNLSTASGGNMISVANVEAGSALANNLTMVGATTTNPVQLVAGGSDTNVGITIAGKGSGVVTVSSPTRTSSAQNSGIATLTSGTPSTATVTVPTGSACVCTETTTAANNGNLKCSVSGTTLTITGPNTVTDVIAYHCS